MLTDDRKHYHNVPQVQFDRVTGFYSNWGDKPHAAQQSGGEAESPMMIQAQYVRNTPMTIPGADAQQDAARVHHDAVAHDL